MWEYKFIEAKGGYGWQQKLEQELNELGKQGWELILALSKEGVIYNMIFKRPITTR
jgi:hypothetical protein